MSRLCKKKYPKGLTLNKSNISNDLTPFLDFKIKRGSLIYDTLDDFSFPILNFPFLDMDISLAPSYGFYISQIIRFGRFCSKVSDFNNV